MDFTREQQDAVFLHDQNLVVVAGAGSGKTRVLVERYLALLEAHPDWSLGTLVAITFTKKAAGEMRDRVRQVLDERARTAQDSARWMALLAQIDGARIDTLHGLCADLLRANAAEAGIDPGFGVLDEFGTLLLRSDVVDSVLADAVQAGGDVLELFAEYPQSDIQTALTRMIDLYAPIPSPDALMRLWRGVWEETVYQQAGVFLREVESIGTCVPAPDDKLGGQWQTCIDNLDAIHDALGRARDAGEDHTVFYDLYDFLKCIDKVDLRGGSARNWGSADAVKESRAMLNAIREVGRAALGRIGEPPGEREARAARLTPLWGALILSARDAYQAAKARQGLLDFDDLERMARDLLANHPRVAARYRGVEFKHLLVDEFQDTNSAQWDIVRALAGVETPGALFVVGDPKQSIYAFRGADVSVFGQVEGQINAAGGRSLPLSTSFRTHQPLVACFNTLFGRLLVRDNTGPAAAYQVELGKPMTAHRELPPDPEQAAVEVILIDKDAPDDDSGAMDSADRRQWEAYEIARRLHEMTDSGLRVYDRHTNTIRPVRYDDMAILFQSLKQVTVYEEVFKTMGLPFVTVAGRGYYDRIEVWDLLNLLRVVYDPADDLAMAAVLRSPMFNLSDDALFALRLSESDDVRRALWDALDAPGDLFPPEEIGRVTFAREHLRALREMAGRVTISELLHDALDRTGYLAVLTGLPDGARRRGNIEKLLEKAHATGKTTLGEFFRYLQDLSTREAREGEASVEVAGAVSVMTVHASKGLEFPVVVLVDASWVRNASLPVLIEDGCGGVVCKVYDADADKMVESLPFAYAKTAAALREEAERLRLLYVAMTRAQDVVVISGQAVQDKNTGRWKASGWLDTLLDGLGLRDRGDEARGVAAHMDYAGYSGLLRVFVPAELPAGMSAAVGETFPAWDAAPPDMQPDMPNLLRKVPASRSEQARHLSATHIADLGGIEHATPDSAREYARERFMRQVFHDAPAHLEPVSVGTGQQVARQLGEIVHEALRHRRLPGEDDEALQAMLDSFAWRQGIVDAGQRADAVAGAFRLLDKFRTSDVYGWLADAVQVYPELPFIYHTPDGHIIHGVIDVLLQRPDGRWVVIDYKTGTVHHAHAPGILEQHALRYHLQVGVYADAVRAQMHITPETYIHYVRYTQTVKIATDAWQAALAQGIGARIDRLDSPRARR